MGGANAAANGKARWNPIRAFTVERASSRARLALYGLVASATAIALAIHHRAYGVNSYPLDDAFITAHNAYVLHAGFDRNFGAVSPLTGSTSPVHLALVTLLAFFAPTLTALYMAAWLAILAYTLGIARLAFDLGGSTLQSALLVFAGVTVAYTPLQLLNGVETGLAMASVVWLIVLLNDDTQFTKAAALCGILPFVRPELSALALLALALIVIRRVSGASDRNVARRLALRDLLVAMATFTPWVVWSLASAGTIVPSTIAAKRYFTTSGSAPLLMKWATSSAIVRQFAAYLGLLGLGILPLFRTATGRIGALFMAIFLLTYTFELPAALAVNWERYLYIFVPILLYGVAITFRAPQRGIAIGATILLAMCCVVQSRGAPGNWAAYVDECRTFGTCNRDMCLWIDRSLPSSSVVMVHDAGAISFYTRLRVVDIVGLKTPSSIDVHREIAARTGRTHLGQAADIIATRSGAGYFLTLKTVEKSAHIGGLLRLRGWSVTPIHTQCDYVLYTLGSPVRGAAPRAAATTGRESR